MNQEHQQHKQQQRQTQEQQLTRSEEQYNSFINKYNINNKSFKSYNNESLAVISPNHFRIGMLMLVLFLMKNETLSFLEIVYQKIETEKYQVKSCLMENFFIDSSLAPLPEISFLILNNLARPTDQFRYCSTTYGYQ